MVSWWEGFCVVGGGEDGGGLEIGRGGGEEVGEGDVEEVRGCWCEVVVHEGEAAGG